MAQPCAVRRTHTLTPVGERDSDTSSHYRTPVVEICFYRQKKSFSFFQKTALGRTTTQLNSQRTESLGRRPGPSRFGRWITVSVADEGRRSVSEGRGRFLLYLPLPANVEGPEGGDHFEHYAVCASRGCLHAGRRSPACGIAPAFGVPLPTCPLTAVSCVLRKALRLSFGVHSLGRSSAGGDDQRPTDGDQRPTCVYTQGRKR